jgi:hypothetical protein
MLEISAWRRGLVALVIAGYFVSTGARTRIEADAQTNDTRPIEAVITLPDLVDSKQVTAWAKEGFDAVALVLDERFKTDAYHSAADAIRASSLDLFYWVEVARNPTMAAEHPEWMASLGMHDDWRKRFSNVRALEDGEVAKAWPWTPIAYREAFDAHLSRIKQLLERTPSDYRGVLLNDLQGGPSACGCGNLQCRWAIDYGVPATTEKRAGVDWAARFVAEVAKLARNKTIVPVWTTECERHDMAPEKLSQAQFSTGYCGSVDCYDNCRNRFAEQWAALHATHRGPTGVLVLHKEFQRDGQEYGAPTQWITRAVDYLDQQQVERVPHQRLWLVVQGYEVTGAEERAARETALKTGAGAVFVARTHLDQSYEPRIVRFQEFQPQQQGSSVPHAHETQTYTSTPRNAE